MLKALWRTVSALAVLASLATTADAGLYGTLNLTSQGRLVSTTGVGSVYGYGVLSGGPFTFKVGAGSSLPTGTLLTTYCLQLNQNVNTGAYQLRDLNQSPTGGNIEPGSDADLKIISPPSNYDPNSPQMSDEAVALIQELYGDHYASLSTSDDRGAFQLDIWAMEYFGKQLQEVYDGVVPPVTSPAVVVPSGYVAGNSFTAAQLKELTHNHVDFTNNSSWDLQTNTLALSWLNQALGAKNHGTYAVFALVNPNFPAGVGSSGYQDQIVTFGGGPPPLITVPEPASLAVWGMLGLVGVAYGRRRKQA